MELLAYDDDFDFNFQEFQYLKEEQTILPVCMFFVLFHVKKSMSHTSAVILARFLLVK